MQTMMNIYRDDKYKIVLSTDNWKAMIIQVAVKGIKKVLTAEGTRDEEIWLVAWSKTVDAVKFDPTKKIVPQNASEFKKEVIAAIQESKDQLAKVQLVESMQVGVFKDYENQTKQYNG